MLIDTSTITVRMSDPVVVDFLSTNDFDVEAMIKSLIPHITVISSYGSDANTVGVKNNETIDMIIKSVKYALDNSATEISNQNVIAIDQLKIDISKEIRDLHTKSTENSSVKGAHSEQRVMNPLVKNFHSLEISDTSKELHSCDMRIKFEDDLFVLIENKDYSSKNIPQKEVNKFLKDIKFNNTSGVLFSQSSGVANKQNFQLDIVSDTTVALYVSNVNHDHHIIIAAIDIIKNVTLLLRNYRQESSLNVKISNEQLKGISTELNTYNEKILQVKKLVGNFEKDLMATIGTIDFRVTTEIVNGGVTAFTNSANLSNMISDTFKCDICNLDFVCKGSLTKHTKKVHL